MAVISMGITLSYKQGESGEFTALTNLVEIPELGGTGEAIDVTTLADPAFMYMDGLKSYGDSLEFKFWYEKEQFQALNALEGTVAWKVSLPDGEACSFNGTASVRLEGVGANAAISYILAIKPNSEMIWA